MESKGTDVKIWGVVLLILNIIATIVGAVSLMVYGVIGAGIAVLIIGIAESAITYLIVSCIGQTEENTQIIIRKLNTISKELHKQE